MTRFLAADLSQAGKTSIDAMPRDTVRDQDHYARVHWQISLLYLTGLRISEVVSNPMDGFLSGRTATVSSLTPVAARACLAMFAN